MALVQGHRNYGVSAFLVPPPNLGYLRCPCRCGTSAAIIPLVPGSYALRTGDDAVVRLQLLSEAKNPSTFELFQRIGGWNGLAVLDLGCGIGSVTRELARLSGTGRVLGLDPDERVIAEARKTGLEFQVGTLADLPEWWRFDRIFARYVLSHQLAPLPFLIMAREKLKPGGMLIVEDIDFDGHVCWPPSPAFDRYVALFKEVVAKRGGDACLGPKLPSLFEAAGLCNVKVSETTPLFRSGPAKEIAPITLRHVSRPLLYAGLVESEELEELVGELEVHCRRPDVLVSLARTFQVSGETA
jgi:SAM-dependent methyltransferase